MTVMFFYSFSFHIQVQWYKTLDIYLFKQLVGWGRVVEVGPAGKSQRVGRVDKTVWPG